MGMRKKMRSEGANKRRTRSKCEGSVTSDGDYKIEDDGEFEDSDEYFSFFTEEELRDEKQILLEEDSDEDHVYDDDDVEEEGDAKDWMTGFPKRKINGYQKVIKEKTALYMEENDNDCKDEDFYENYNRSEDELWKGSLRKKQNRLQKRVRKKKAAYMEEIDDDYEYEDDVCDEDDDYSYNEFEMDLRKGCQSGKQNGFQKALKRKKAAYTKENNDDYEAEDDECYDENVYDNEEEEVEDEDDDEDFTPDQFDLADEDELVVKKTKKVRRTSQRRLLSRGRKRRNSRVSNKSKRKKLAKRSSLQKKSSSSRRKEAKKKSTVKETKDRNSGPKTRRLAVDSDSDFFESEPLLLDQEYTMSEEEREQVQEASRFCGKLDVTLRNSYSKKRSREEGNLHQELEHKSRKGEDKVDDSKNEAAKKVCGICFSEERKRTVRGTLDCCSHFFCFNCTMEWSKVESRCPLCKQRFANISKHAKSDIVSNLRTIIVRVPERDQVYQPSEEELMSYLDPYENAICTECYHGGDDANMLLCDLCDSPAHTYCVGLSEVPEGNWYCEACGPIALSPSNTEAPSFTHDRRTNDLSVRLSFYDNVREDIDLNRVYEPETSLDEGTMMSSFPRPFDENLRAGSSVPGVGVQIVRKRRMRHQHIAQGRTMSFGFQNAMGPYTSSFNSIFSRGILHENFASSLPIMHLSPASPSHLRDHQVWGQIFTGFNGSADTSGPLPASLAWSIHGYSSTQ